MKKSDLYLVIITILISIILIIYLNVNTTSSNVAYVYYNNKEILRLDLNIKSEYTVEGYIDDVVIETDIGKVRVKKETSPKHLCSKQGWVSNAYTPIICLPNKIVIKIDNKENQVDTVVR